MLSENKRTGKNSGMTKNVRLRILEFPNDEDIQEFKTFRAKTRNFIRRKKKAAYNTNMEKKSNTNNSREF